MGERVPISDTPAMAPDAPSQGEPRHPSPIAAHTASPAELALRSRFLRRGAPFLVFRDPDRGEVLVSLEDRSHLTIGRRADSDVAPVWDDRVSRLHAELALVGSDWVVIDDGLSANGTWIGTERIASRRRLDDGDVIRVGETLIAFCAPRGTGSPTAPADDIQSVLRISPAQLRVLRALCRPLLLEGSMVPPSNSQLSSDLFLSENSIKSHLRSLYELLGLDAVESRQKRAALVERAVKLGVVKRSDLETGTPG